MLIILSTFGGPKNALKIVVMKSNKLFRTIIIFSAALGVSSPALALEKADLVRAKIGIEVVSKDSSRAAKTKDRIIAGSKLRIYVLPENDSYIYIINSDNSNSVLLNSAKEENRIPRGALKIYPSTAHLYAIGETATKEFFAILCSPVKQKEVVDLFSSGTVPREKWLTLERKLVEQGKIPLNEIVPKSFGVAGNIRSPKGEEFANKLHVFSGSELLIKRYAFNVKK